MMDALAHLPDPTVSGTRFSDELLIFCKEFSPTTHELKSQTSPNEETGTGRLQQSPLSMPRRGETDEHSGMTEPTERGDTPTLWESHMIKWFLDGLLPHISAAIKKSCVGYEDARLT
ncbi:hypothetical protein L3Q82_002412 [Scortum barcoo]|uniref:Uncharacterized protein n=1 Tax=Scortum barcoo TaxID=214431 RepID=A0ACB8VZ90_9TELE|nr:hypothetical protein L3Q82_002412 [Scortum barcoo]